MRMETIPDPDPAIVAACSMESSKPGGSIYGADSVRPGLSMSTPEFHQAYVSAILSVHSGLPFICVPSAHHVALLRLSSPMRS